MKKVKVKPETPFKERRRTQRLNIPIRVKYNPLHRKGILHETFCWDISGGGMKLDLDYPLRKRDRIKTLLHFPDDPNPVTVFNTVVWCKRRPAEEKEIYFAVGMRHTKIKPKDRERFIFLFCEAMINHFLTGQQK